MDTPDTARTGPDWLDARIAAGATVLMDGGTGTELERRGVPMTDRIWCGAANFEHADALRRVHEDYIRAGAQVITTNTFATARHALEPAGFGDDVARANRVAVEAALAARERSGVGDVAIAGSMSDFIADRQDRSWCREDRLRATFREQAEILAEAGVELLAMEMMQEPEIAIPAIEAAIDTGLPVWVGCSCRRTEQGHLGFFDAPERDFRELLEAIDGLPVGVVGIMHSEIPDMIPGLEAVRERWSGPLCAYPESGYFKMPHWQFVDIVSTEDLVAEARVWRKMGVQIIGGCCGIGPEHIAALHRALQSEADGEPS